MFIPEFYDTESAVDGMSRNLQPAANAILLALHHYLSMIITQSFLQNGPYSLVTHKRNNQVI